MVVSTDSTRLLTHNKFFVHFHVVPLIEQFSSLFHQLIFKPCIRLVSSPAPFSNIHQTNLTKPNSKVEPQMNGLTKRKIYVSQADSLSQAASIDSPEEMITPKWAVPVAAMLSFAFSGFVHVHFFYVASRVFSWEQMVFFGLHGSVCFIQVALTPYHLFGKIPWIVCVFLNYCWFVLTSPLFFAGLGKARFVDQLDTSNGKHWVE